MKKLTYILLSVIIVILIIAVSVLYSKNQSYNNRINTISKSIEKIALRDSVYVNHMTQKTQFKEDYYIKQQDYNTTLILTVFGITIGVFSLLSYTSFLGVIKSLETKIEKNNAKHEKDIKTHENRLIELSNDVSYQLGMITLNEAKEILDLSERIMHIITGCEHLSKAIVDPINENEEYINSTKGIILDNIEILSKLVDEDLQMFVYSNLKPERLQLKQDRIKKVIPPNSGHLLNKVFSRVVVG